MKTKCLASAGMRVGIVLLVLTAGFALEAVAETDFTGVYLLVPNDATLPGGLKNEGGAGSRSLAAVRGGCPEDEDCGG